MKSAARPETKGVTSIYDGNYIGWRFFFFQTPVVAFYGLIPNGVHLCSYICFAALFESHEYRMVQTIKISLFEWS